MDLFDRRLLIVTGKGGTGKSVIAAALAVLASRRGKNALVAQMDTEDRLGQLLGARFPIGSQVVAIRERLSAVVLSQRTILEEYLKSYVKIKAIYNRILESRVFNYFYEAAPALKELIAIARLVKLVESHSFWSARPTWDVVVFDAPSTGHGLGLLRVPESSSEILLGRLKTSAIRIQSVLRDPAITAVNIVAIPEEMPVNESVMLHREARDVVRLPLGCLFVNGVVPERFTGEEKASLETLARDHARLASTSRAAFGEGGESVAPGLVVAARHEVERGALSARYVRELEEKIDLPAVQIPSIACDRFGPAEVERVATILDGALRSTPRDAA